VLNCNLVCWHESQVIQLLQEVLGILEFVHSHGLIHRDVKPSNLIRRQQDGRLFLIDFGSVNQAWTQVVRTDNHHLCDWLTAPLLLAHQAICLLSRGGQTTPNSDIYALGDWHQALTGLNPRQLLETHTSEVIWQHQPKLALSWQVSSARWSATTSKTATSQQSTASAAATSQSLLTNTTLCFLRTVINTAGSPQTSTATPSLNPDLLGRTLSIFANNSSLIS